MEHKAFITGSRAYGKPTAESDTDLVVRVDKEAADELVKLSDGGSFPIRFGNLNIVCAYNDATWEVWKQGTEELIKQKPVTRQEAIEHFKKLAIDKNLMLGRHGVPSGELVQRGDLAPEQDSDDECDLI